MHLFALIVGECHLLCAEAVDICCSTINLNTIRRCDVQTYEHISLVNDVLLR